MHNLTLWTESQGPTFPVPKLILLWVSTPPVGSDCWSFPAFSLVPPRTFSIFIFLVSSAPLNIWASCHGPADQSWVRSVWPPTPPPGSASSSGTYLQRITWLSWGSTIFQMVSGNKDLIRLLWGLKKYLTASTHHLDGALPQGGFHGDRLWGGDVRAKDFGAVVSGTTSVRMCGQQEKLNGDAVAAEAFAKPTGWLELGWSLRVTTKGPGLCSCAHQSPGKGYPGQAVWAWVCSSLWARAAAGEERKATALIAEEQGALVLRGVWEHAPVPSAHSVIWNCVCFTLENPFPFPSQSARFYSD